MPSLLDIWQPPRASQSFSWDQGDAAQAALLGNAVRKVEDDPWSRERYSLLQFVQDAWHVMESEPFIPGWHLEAFAQHLEAIANRKIQRLLCNLPMRSGKSVVQMVMFPAWIWITNPAEQFLCTSFNKELALHHAVTCRRLMMSSWYRDRWGDRFRLRGDVNVKSRYENTRGGARVTVAVGGATGSGGSMLLVDDLHSRDEDDSSTHAEMQGAKSFFNNDFAGCLVNPQTACIVVTGQRVAIDDISADILARGGYAHLKIRQEYIAPAPGERQEVTPLGWSDPRTVPGALMHPARWGPKQVAEAKLRGSHAYQAHHQQDPEGVGGTLFQDAWWKVFTEWPDFTSFKKIIHSWDMRMKDDKEAGSFVVGQCWGLSPNGLNVFLLDEVRGRWGYVETKEAFVGFCKKWPTVRTKLIENKANGPAIYSDLRSKTFGLVLVEPDGGKRARSNKHTSSAEAGHIWLPADTLVPWINDWRREVQHSPSEPNDRIDAATQAWDYLLPRQIADDPRADERKREARKRQMQKLAQRYRRPALSETGV